MKTQFFPILVTNNSNVGLDWERGFGLAAECSFNADSIHLSFWVINEEDNERKELLGGDWLSAEWVDAENVQIA